MAVQVQYLEILDHLENLELLDNLEHLEILEHLENLGKKTKSLPHSVCGRDFR